MDVYMYVDYVLHYISINQSINQSNELVMIQMRDTIR